MFDSIDMTAREWITVTAVILGPILAIQAQRIVDSLRLFRMFHVLRALQGNIEESIPHPLLDG
jgi:hypothetical protein